MVTADDVKVLVDLFHSNRISYWIAGGWGIDALIGRATRDHHDLDLHIGLDQLDEVIDILAIRRYTKTIDQAPIRVELTDPSGRVVDLHPLRIEVDGSGHGAMFDGGSWIIKADGLNSRGSIDGLAVSCVSVAEQIRDHCEYEPRAIDREAMSLLADTFDIELPYPFENPRA